MTSLFFLQPQPVLAQVVFGSSPAALLGIALAASGAGLYFLRAMRPQLARDYDIAMAAVALLAGSILFFQGWRLDPILTFGCYLLAGAAGFFAFEAIRLRGATTEQAKRYSPVVDEERPVSRVYRAELDELSSVEERPAARRIRGSRDYRSSDAEGYVEDTRRSPASRSGDRPSPSPNVRRRSSSRPSSGRSANRPARTDWDETPPSRSDRNLWEDEAPASSSNYYSGSPSNRDAGSSSRPRRPRPSSGDDVRRRPIADEPPANYVDYQPVDYSDSDFEG
ncbi:Ycf66 family protein [Leptolyngbya sp. AN02str]|uniref:Ycf66 family protein n=1 Tax=Leptolyngbya sp. AN02str TaxID=3423363 RepID=UPI003D315B6A